MQGYNTTIKYMNMHMRVRTHTTSTRARTQLRNVHIVLTL